MMDFNERLSELTKPIAAVENGLRKTAHFAECTAGPLSWKPNENGMWRIFFNDKPLQECKVQDRISSIAFLGPLVERADEAMEKAIHAAAPGGMP